MSLYGGPEGPYIPNSCLQIQHFQTHINFSATGLESEMPVFLMFLCVLTYYRSWQAEILQERAEGCIQVDLQKKIRKIMHFYLWFCRGGFWS